MTCGRGGLGGTQVGELVINELHADADELQQRMERPENQSRMAAQRQQLEQTRNDMQRASEAAAAGVPTIATRVGPPAFIALHPRGSAGPRRP